MYGWDGLGHMAVAYVPYQTLSPQLRLEVTRLVRLNPSYGAWTANVPIADRDLHAFMLAATWPDQIKSDGQHVSGGPCNGNRPPAGVSPKHNHTILFQSSPGRARGSRQSASVCIRRRPWPKSLAFFGVR